MASKITKRMFGTAEIFRRLRQSFITSDGIKLNSEKCHREIHKLIFKKFNERFDSKAVTQYPLQKYPPFVENLQKRFKLTDKTKESLLDALDCRDGQEKEETFEFNDGIGELYLGRVIAVKKNGKMDLAYAVYNVTFELGGKETVNWVFKWFSSVVPIGWERRTKVQMLSEDQKKSLSEWGRHKLHDRVVEEYLRNETFDD